jgi:hypothetical protein
MKTFAGAVIGRRAERVAHVIQVSPASAVDTGSTERMVFSCAVKLSKVLAKIRAPGNCHCAMANCVYTSSASMGGPELSLLKEPRNNNDIVCAGERGGGGGAEAWIESKGLFRELKGRSYVLNAQHSACERLENVTQELRHMPPQLIGSGPGLFG